jgi:hypothetical protein
MLLAVKEGTATACNMLLVLFNALAEGEQEDGYERIS